MELLYGKIQLFMMIYLALNAQAQGNFGIVEPFPENIYPLEFSSAQVTCVAFDSTGVKVPDRIKFTRKNRYAEYTTLEENNNLHFTNMTELVHQGGKQFKKIVATMYIKNVTLDDDSQYGILGRYECHAFAVNDTTPRKHGFSVNVITPIEIPTIHVTKPGNLQDGESYTLRCNVTNQGYGATSLKRISWFKNGNLLETVRSPDPSSPKDFLKPIMITEADAKDGGVYICLLEVLVRGVANFNVTDHAMVAAQGNFGIVEPFPENIYPLEFSSAQVTCVAFDSTGVKVPDRIKFTRKNRYAEYTTLEENNNLHFTNMTELVHQGGKQFKKIVATMYIKNVTLDDDSQYGILGRYECHAFAVNDTTPRKHGFSVNVITPIEIPTIHVTKPGNLQHGKKYTLRCNVTNQGYGATSLKRISWFKNGNLLETVRLPDPSSPKDFLKPIMITEADAKDGGVYICLLEVLVRGVANFNVTDHAMVAVAPWFDKPKEDIKVSTDMGDKVSFECGAKGFPLEVEWRTKTRRKSSIQYHSCINSSDEKYEITDGGITNTYVLTVSDLQYSDSGFYYCCLSSNCSSSHPNKDNCQRFILEVSKKSGSEREMCDTYVLGTLFACMIMMYMRNQP